MTRYLLIIIILLTNTCSIGQKTIEIHLNDIRRIHSQFGLDSLEKVINEIPIWNLDTALSISILNSINPNEDRYSWGNKFITEFGRAIKSKKIDSKLKQLLNTEILIIKETDFVKNKFQAPSDQVLLGLLFQASDDLEQTFEKQLIQLDIIRNSIFNLQPKKKLKYFFKGWPQVKWNKYEINFSEFKLLSCLNRLNPIKYPDKLLGERRKGLHPSQEYYSLAETPTTNMYFKETGNEEIVINGISLPKEIISQNELSDKCWFIKIVKDEDNYILEKGCSTGPLAGRGETLMIRRVERKFKIRILRAWVS